ncbi:MAG TPA: GTPase Era [Bacteroidota bacterium]|nr:GTPase Era [Bacteroidota bacterium]
MPQDPLPGEAVPRKYHAGYVALVGEPNVGKSTLMNAFVGTKISIVSDKPQTTRHRIVGIVSREDCQIVCLDTPGIITPKYLLHEVMMGAVRSAMEDADVICCMIDAAHPKTGPRYAHDLAHDLLRSVAKPLYIIINKIDLVPRDALLPVIGFYSETYAPKEIFPISARHGTGTGDLLDALAREMPAHPAYYSTDVLSEHPERFFVAELIREAIFRKFRKELPYSTTVDILEFREAEARKDLIRAEIYVERDTQRAIIIGRKGLALKTVGADARSEIEAFLGRPVFLELYVKVRKQWREDDAWLKRLGYH